MFYHHMSSIQELKSDIRRNCENVPLHQATSLSKTRTSKRRRPSRPVTQFARGIRATLLPKPSCSVVVTNPHDAAAVYTSGCYGKGSFSKGPPDGLLDGSEHLILSPFEAMYLVETGALCVFSTDEKQLKRYDLWGYWLGNDRRFSHRYSVYKHFRDKHYTVRSGLKYGGDFLLYSGDPNTTHAAYVVKVMSHDPQMVESHDPQMVGSHDMPEWTEVNSVRRVSESVAKECVLAYVSLEGQAGRESLDDVATADVTLVLLKRWIPERDREVENKKSEKD